MKAMLSFSIVSSLIFLRYACPGAGSVPAFSLNEPAYRGTEDSLWSTNSGMYGWTFEVLQPVTVTGLGWYDNNGGDGLFHPHQIGIWPGGLYSHHVTNILLGSITIPAGTVAPLESPNR